MPPASERDRLAEIASKPRLKGFGQGRPRHGVFGWKKAHQPKPVALPPRREVSTRMQEAREREQARDAKRRTDSSDYRETYLAMLRSHGMVS